MRIQYSVLLGLLVTCAYNTGKLSVLKYVMAGTFGYKCLQNSIHCGSVANVNGDFDFSSDMNTTIKHIMCKICIFVLNKVFALTDRAQVILTSDQSCVY